MSRRQPSSTTDRATPNQDILKSLVKVEGNKSCADCKKNKHPRWASWNLGVFVCIRCSGIHRGMGTHISRVKSVDLDSWTDEQLRNVLRWGNARANKYWEAKLTPGHVPAEAKIENFIRTKYESKRWVMDGPMPDPATLDAEGDDDVPLNVVQEKAKLDKSTPLRSSSTPGQSILPPNRRPQRDLLDEDAVSPIARPSTVEPSVRQPPPKADPAPPKQTKPGDSLLGLDFLGGPQSAPSAQPAASSTSASTVPSRPDLKQSILSLYAPAPKTAIQSQSQPSNTTSSSGLKSPSQGYSQQSSVGGLNDAFSGLSFSTTTLQQTTKPSPFADLNSPSTQPAPSARNNLTSPPGKPSSSGGFFDIKPQATATSSQPVTKPVLSPRTFSQSSGFGDFTSAQSPIATSPPKVGGNADFGGLLDFSPPPSQPSTNKPAATTPRIDSVFNLSKPLPSQSQLSPLTNSANANSSGVSSGFSNLDAWGSSEAWSTPGPVAAAKAPTSTLKSPPLPTVSSSDFGWGSNGSGILAGTKATTPHISADEDFGGWSSTVPQTPKGGPPSSNPAQKPPGPADDVWYNVWE